MLEILFRDLGSREVSPDYFDETILTKSDDDRLSAYRNGEEINVDEYSAETLFGESVEQVTVSYDRGMGYKATTDDSDVTVEGQFVFN